MAAGASTSGQASEAVTVSNFPAIQPVSQSGAWSVAVSNFPATQPVSGTVAVSNFPATQAVTQSGGWSVSVSNFPATQAVTQSGGWSVSVSNFPATQPVSGTVGVSNLPTTVDTNTGNAGASTVRAVLASNQPAIPATQSGAWAVSVSNFPATQPVSGTVAVSNFPATQAVTQSGAWSVSVSNFPATQAVTQSGSWAVTSNPGQGATLAVNQISVGTTATIIKAANSSRYGIVIYNTSGVTVFIGGSNAVTTSTGHALPTLTPMSFDAYKGDIYGIVAASTASVTYAEEAV